MNNLFQRLYNQRQTGFSTPLKQRGIRIYKDGSTIRATMSFAMLGFDEMGQAKEMQGITVKCASCPDDVEIVFKTQLSDRGFDAKVIDLAYSLGCCDLCRFQYRNNRLEWFFKPSPHAVFSDRGWRLDDRRIDDKGYRTAGKHGLFPHRLNDDFSQVNCYQHIYEFCGCKLVKK